MTRRTALIRRPGPRLADGLVTHLEKSEIDLGLAVQQWEDYTATLRTAGWETVEVPAADECPDAVFIEDAVVVSGDLAILTNPGAAERKPEVAAVEGVVRDLGYRVVRIEDPGTLDGGDVLKVGDTAYVGLGGRTNGAGIQQLAGHLESVGMRTQAVTVERALHLKSAVTALPNGTVIGWDPVVDWPGAFPHYEGMPEEGGAHVVLLDDNLLLMAASAPRTAELMRSRGHEVVTVDISEFEKLEGCVTCLSVRCRG
ncbi:N(G),N(G)-dimethylarginine dimethylaminohydrolase [Knoellia sinensis KCTC 19936]|uniref:N(G),N(G)-dimethylarginine dimethylaminohydrolase n=1 Tax=Knoellia sinensis KCTC 19936 TaxID=1385520 RepID=A0A0A0JG98_9MICO|nr:dimethylargininase [Knoellia sinensis]KGN34626.1 N(G),N(G)-dimethylarginine dimethylaminohydrolase [Knoellia sinensis KCTC 19936]